MKRNSNSIHSNSGVGVNSKRERLSPSFTENGQSLQSEPLCGSSSNHTLTNSWKLAFEKQPPEFPFVNDAFEIEVYLLDENNEVIKLSEKMTNEISVKLRLVVSPTMTEVEAQGENKNVLQLVDCDNDSESNYVNGKGREDDEVVVRIDRNGCGTASIAVCELSSYHNNHQFCIEAAPIRNSPFEYQNDHLIERVEIIEPCTSKEFRVVSHRLKLTSELPNLWFKDQGGRENCISATIALDSPPFSSVDHLEDSIPLAVSLVYESQEKVNDPKGNILSLHADSVLEISKTNPEALVKFRVDDVSKNHQSKGFCLLVEPKRTSQHADISSVISEPIVVKSKPNIKKIPKKKPNLRRKPKSVTKHEGNGTQCQVQLHGNPGLCDVFPALLDKEVKVEGFCDTLKTLYQLNVTDTIPMVQAKLEQESQANKGGPKEPSVASSALNIGTWCDTVKNVLCELRQISVRKKNIEDKLWTLLSSYPEVIQNFQNLSNFTSEATEQSIQISPGATLNGRKKANGSQQDDIGQQNIVRSSSLSSTFSIPSLTHSTQQLISGLSSEILLNQSNTVQLMLNGLKSFNINHKMETHDSDSRENGISSSQLSNSTEFTELAGRAASSELLRDHSLMGGTDHRNSGLMDRLVREYENSK